MFGSSKLCFGMILGIHDVRTDPRIDFVGGMRGLKELERRVADDCDVVCALSDVAGGV